MEDLERQSLKELEELKDGLMNEINSITKYSLNSKLSWLSIRDVFFDSSRNEFFTNDGMKRIYLLEIKDKTTGESIFKDDNKPLSERSISHVKESYEFYQKVLGRLKAIKEEIFKKTFGFYPRAKKEEDKPTTKTTKVNKKHKSVQERAKMYLEGYISFYKNPSNAYLEFIGINREHYSKINKATINRILKEYDFWHSLRIKAVEKVPEILYDNENDVLSNRLTKLIQQADHFKNSIEEKNMQKAKKSIRNKEVLKQNLK